MPISRFQLELILVFFIYGLAFFSMGLTMLLESGRSPLLAEGRVLRFLAVFGFLHGAHEWMEMALQMSQWAGLSIPPAIAWLRVGLLVASFTFLLAFGLRVLRPQGRFFSRRFVLIGASLISLFALVLLITAYYRPVGLSDLAVHADVWSRYTLAVPGAFLGALALNRQAGQAGSEGRRQLTGSLRIAALSFGFYSLTQLFVPSLDMFPANIVNTGVFLSLTGMPIQVVRAGLAVAITTSLFRATQLVDEERRRQFKAVQQSRLEALDQIRQELIEREKMRKELLRHTVIAQEEERARIARELHDETAQLLTALSLNLAALRDSLPLRPPTREILTRLQDLSRQMSQGIYRMVHDLRPAQLDDLGLVAALQVLADEERKRVDLGITVSICGERRRLDPLVETVFFRIAQEALNNVARHAQVNQAYLELFFEPDQARLRVCDRGVGFDVEQDLLPPHGWGLAGMRERADSVCGHFQILSVPGQGTTVEISVPDEGCPGGEP